MADNNLRSGRDPLAELARLIAQGARAESASSDAYDAPRSSATHVDRAAQVFSTRDDQMNERHSHVGEQDTPSPPFSSVLPSRGARTRLQKSVCRKPLFFLARGAIERRL